LYAASLDCIEDLKRAIDALVASTCFSAARALVPVASNAQAKAKVNSRCFAVGNHRFMLSFSFFRTFLLRRKARSFPNFLQKNVSRGMERGADGRER
jgi:hypothetical protein